MPSTHHPFFDTLDTSEISLAAADYLGYPGQHWEPAGVHASVHHWQAAKSPHTRPCRWGTRAEPRPLRCLQGGALTAGLSFPPARLTFLVALRDGGFAWLVRSHAMPPLDYRKDRPGVGLQRSHLVLGPTCRFPTTGLLEGEGFSLSVGEGKSQDSHGLSDRDHLWQEQAFAGPSRMRDPPMLLDEYRCRAGCQAGPCVRAHRARRARARQARQHQRTMRRRARACAGALPPQAPGPPGRWRRL